MEQLTALEREFLKVQEEAFEEDTQGYTSGEWQAKASAALCERKMRDAWKKSFQETYAGTTEESSNRYFKEWLAKLKKP